MQISFIADRLTYFISVVSGGSTVVSSPLTESDAHILAGKSGKVHSDAW